MTKQEIVRDLIRKDQIERALEEAMHISSHQTTDEIVLLSNRYQKWKREKRRGLGENSIERINIINSLLEFVQDSGSVPNRTDEIKTIDEKKDNKPVQAPNNIFPENEKKDWYKRLEVLAPLLVAIIGGVFATLQTCISTDKSPDKTFNYELILIDNQTFTSPLLTSPARIKVYYKSPPEILTLVDGTAKFNTTRNLDDRKTKIEFEGIDNYEFVDKFQLLKSGTNEILVSPTP